TRMLELVSFEDAKHQLRIDDDDDSHDEWLALFIPAVSEAVASWLKDRWRLYLPSRDSDGEVVLDSDEIPVPAEDPNGDPIVHPIVRAAVLIELASQFRFREGEGDNRVEAHEGHGYTLSKTATALLSGLRKSTVA